MSYEEILYNAQDGIATITLNRADKLNAWTRVMEREVREAMIEASRDETVRVIVLTGAGRGFCAGADMGGLSLAGDPTTRDSETRRIQTEIGPIPGGLDLPDDFGHRASYFATVPKPIIAAVNGPAAGIGMIMALFCDVRLAAETAFFTTAFARRGLVAEHGVGWMLTHLIGLQGALDLLLTARRVPADEARRLGLVAETYPEESFREQVHGYAQMLATQVSPRSTRVMKQQLYRGLSQSLHEAIELGYEEMAASFDSEDFKEGVAHFVEKRAPAFTGR